MKFQCDGCKTRYSIADERVRGKILKIRCKNCSSVITVREGMGGGAAAPAKRTAAARAAAARRPAAVKQTEAARRGVKAGSALQGAFEQVMARAQSEPPSPSASDSFRAPDHLDNEWYVSIDGEQSGPFSLSEAKDWVESRPPKEELFCWQEDFDDWLPIEKVGHFRSLRVRADTATAQTGPPGGMLPASSPLAAGAADSLTETREETPKPLFAPTLAKLEAEQKAKQEGAETATTQIEPSQKSDSQKSNGAGENLFDEFDESAEPSDDDADLEFDIGEASRIVKLPALMMSGPNDEAEAGFGIPKRDEKGGLPGVAKVTKGGLGKGTGSAASLEQPLAALSDDAIADAKPGILGTETESKGVGTWIPLAAAGVAVLAVAGVLLYLATGRGSGDDTKFVRSSSGGDGVAVRLPGTGTGGIEILGIIPNEEEPDAATPKITKRVKRPITGTGSKPETNGNNNNNAKTGPRVPGLNGQRLRSLGPSEVVNIMTKNRFSSQRCYERALKREGFFLDVNTMKVKLTIAPSGVVTDVTLKGQYAKHYLGLCLAATIRKWPFRRSTKGITMELTLSFEQR